MRTDPRSTTRHRNRLFTLLLVLSSATVAVGAASAAESANDSSEVRRPSDIRLEERLYVRLLRSPSLAGSDLTVSVGEGHVVLEGEVADENLRERVHRIVRRARGVVSVADRLRLAPDEVAARRDVEVSDESLAERVARTLVDTHFSYALPQEQWLFGWEVDGYAWEFDVDVDDGHVTLEGTVPTYGSILDSLRTAWKVPGVRAVHNGLRVEWDDGWEGPITLPDGSGWSPLGRRPAPYGPYDDTSGRRGERGP